MSTYYGLRCKDDGATSGAGLKSGLETLRYIAGLASQVKSLLDIDVRNVIDINFCLGYSWDYDWLGDEPPVSPFQFLQKHADHQLEMYDEYGRGYPL